MQDEQWRGIEWLFHNARGNFAEASGALASLVRNGDPTGRAASVLVPQGFPPAMLPARAALLNKATLLLKAKTEARVRGGPDVAAAPQEVTSLGSMGAPAESAAARELEEAEVMLAALRLRDAVQGPVAMGDSSSASRAVEGLVRPFRW